MLQDLDRCPRLYWFRAKGWRPEFDSRIFDYGNIMHKLAECRAKAGKSIDCRKSIEDWRRAEVKRRPSAARSIEMSCAKAAGVFPQYERFWKSDYKVEWLAVEKVFEVVSCNFHLKGKIDRFGKVGNDFMLYDTKTKSQIDEEEIRWCLPFDFQALFYTRVLEIMGYPDVEFTYDVVRNPAYRLEAPPDMFRRVSHESKRDPRHFFKRYTVSFSKKERREFRRDLCILLYNAERLALIDVPPPKRRSGCIGRGACPFISACSTGSMVGFTQEKEYFKELEDA
jgi:hypothetical protein